MVLGEREAFQGGRFTRDFKGRFWLHIVILFLNLLLG
jgi:hypothetical protein